MDNTYRFFRILQVSTTDIGGGAEKVAWNLFQAYRTQGHESRLAVGYKSCEDSGILLVPNDNCRSGWARTWIAAGNMLSPLIGRIKGAGLLRGWIHQIGEPNRYLKIRRGYEDFDFPGTRRILDLTARPPDIVHCHNLHGRYFDLRCLPWLSQQVPVVLTLHDAWLLSGLCAHSFDCESWKIGCGKCPYLMIFTAILHDATAYNWQRKCDIFSKSLLYVATPSRWLMQKVEQSILAPAIVDARVIPNGVDLSIFHPADKNTVRVALGIPQDAIVLLFTANRIRQNIWKDYKTIKAAVALVAEHMHGQRVLFFALGDNVPPERIGKAEVQFIPYQKDPRNIARYYQAADIYIHAARADTFPTTILESLACGTPVVATSVGGIPEQVQDGATGFLTPSGDAGAMAARVVQLIEDKDLRLNMGAKAAEDARKRFNLERMTEEYLGWYEEILKHGINNNLSSWRDNENPLP